MKSKFLGTLLAGSLLFTALPLQGQAYAFTKTDAKVVQNVNFRSLPSPSGKRLDYLIKGDTITVLDKVNKYWFKAKTMSGQVGYVSALPKFIQISSPAFEPNTSPQPNIQPVQQAVPQQTSATADKVIAAGKKYWGTPYEFGSSRSNTKTFDCSDFVRQAYLDALGVKLPGNSRTQAALVKKLGNAKTDWRQLKPGDIMFFMSYRGTKASNYNGIDKSKERITHNGIYLGNGKILHTFSTASGGVRIDTIAGKHWEERFIFGGSPLK